MSNSFIAGDICPMMHLDINCCMLCARERMIIAVYSYISNVKKKANLIMILSDNVTRKRKHESSPVAWVENRI